jgi:hypothetical protein
MLIVWHNKGLGRPRSAKCGLCIKRRCGADLPGGYNCYCHSGCSGWLIMRECRPTCNQQQTLLAQPGESSIVVGINTLLKVTVTQ